MRRRCASGCGGSVDLNSFCQSLIAIYLASVQAFAASMPSSKGKSRTATPAERVRLVVALSETGGTLRYIVVSLEARVDGVDGSLAYSFWLGTTENKC